MHKKPFYPEASALFGEVIRWEAEEVSGLTTGQISQLVAAGLLTVAPQGGIYRDQLVGIANRKANGTFDAWLIENGATLL